MLPVWLTGDDPWRRLASKALGEMLGCMLFQFLGSLAPTALGNGVALTPLVFMLAKISGGHLNPAVTLTFALLGHSSPGELLIYWAAQISGCVLGALWIWGIVPNSQGTNGCFVPRPYVSDISVFALEAAGTFCLVTPLFAVVWHTMHKSGYGVTGPLIIGLSLFSAASAVGPWTGAAINPARAMAGPLVFSCQASVRALPYYVLGELTGAVVASLAIAPWYGISARPWYGASYSSAASGVEGRETETDGSDGRASTQSNVAYTCVSIPL